MSHELAFTVDGNAMMAYRGDAPWHRLGTPVTELETPDEWLIAGHLDWQVSKHPIFLADGSALPGKMALLRDDTSGFLDVCSQRWEPHQNIELLSFFRDLVGAGVAHIETVGALYEGRDVWALAKLSPSFNLVLRGNDVIEQYVLLTGSHRVGFSTKAFYTDIRVVCRNTLAWAESSNGSNAARIRHNRRFDADAQNDLKLELRIDVDSLRAQHALYERLAEIQVNERVVNDFTVKLFGDIKTYRANLRTLTDQPRAVAKVIDLFDGNAQGSELISARGTAWGLLNAATEWVDHHRGRNDESTFASAWMGEGKRLKTDALRTLAEYANSGEIPLLTAAA